MLAAKCKLHCLPDVTTSTGQKASPFYFKNNQNDEAQNKLALSQLSTDIWRSLFIQELLHF
jgi:hypothetical protein